MHLSIPLLAATLATLATALPSLQQPQQISFSSPLSDVVSPQSLLSEVDLIALSSLPTDDLAQLEKHILSLPERRKVQLSADSAPIEISEGEKALLTFAGKKFIDVTNDDESTTVAVQSKSMLSMFHSSDTKLTIFENSLFPEEALVLSQIPLPNLRQDLRQGDEDVLDLLLWLPYPVLPIVRWKAVRKLSSGSNLSNRQLEQRSQDQDQRVPSPLGTEQYSRQVRTYE